jgi:outer membrane murein-binding lipoprotein Lpp
MNKTLAIVLTTSFLLAGCSSADKKDDMAKTMTTPAVTQAKADLDKAIAAGAEWRLIDTATGGKAVNLSKLMKVAEEKAAAGETDEANRIAARISQASETAIEQSKRYAATAPYYN